MQVETLQPTRSCTHAHDNMTNCSVEYCSHAYLEADNGHDEMSCPPGASTSKMDPFSRKRKLPTKYEARRPISQSSPVAITVTTTTTPTEPSCEAPFERGRTSSSPLPPTPVLTLSNEGVVVDANGDFDDDARSGAGHEENGMEYGSAMGSLSSSSSSSSSSAHSTNFSEVSISNTATPNLERYVPPVGGFDFVESVLHAHKQCVTKIAFSKHIAELFCTSSADGSIKVFNITRAHRHPNIEHVRTFRLPPMEETAPHRQYHTGAPPDDTVGVEVTDLEWCLDGMHLVSTHRDGRVCLWNAASLEVSSPDCEIRVEKGPVNCVCVKPAAQVFNDSTGGDLALRESSVTVVVGTSRGCIYLVDLSPCAPITTGCFAYSSTPPKRLIRAKSSSSVADRLKSKNLSSPDGISALAFTKDGRFLFSGDQSGYLQVFAWDHSRTYEYKLVTRIHQRPRIACLSFIESMRLLVVNSVDSKVRLYSVPDLQESKVFFNLMRTSIFRGSTFPVSDFVFFGCDNNCVCVYDAQSCSLVQKLGEVETSIHHNPENNNNDDDDDNNGGGVDVDRGGDGGSYGGILSSSIDPTSSPHMSPVSCVGVSRGEEYVASGDTMGNIHLWAASSSVRQ